jgi:hypothetical protein
MKTVLTVAVTIVAMVGLAGAALACMGPRHGPGGMGHGMMRQMGPHMMAQGAGPMGPGRHGGAMHAASGAPILLTNPPVTRGIAAPLGTRRDG